MHVPVRLLRQSQAVLEPLWVLVRLAQGLVFQWRLLWLHQLLHLHLSQLPCQLSRCKDR